MSAPTRESTTRAATTREITSRPPIVTNDDPFYLPPAVLERAKSKGVRLEWKRVSVRGMEDDANQDELQRTGWMPVPYDEHPELGGPL